MRIKDNKLVDYNYWDIEQITTDAVKEWIGKGCQDLAQKLRDRIDEIIEINKIIQANEMAETARKLRNRELGIE